MTQSGHLPGPELLRFRCLNAAYGHYVLAVPIPDDRGFG